MYDFLIGLDDGLNIVNTQILKIKRTQLMGHVPHSCREWGQKLISNRKKAHPRSCNIPETTKTY